MEGLSRLRPQSHECLCRFRDCPQSLRPIKPGLVGYLFLRL